VRSHWFEPSAARPRDASRRQWCEVWTAITAGELSERRLQSYLKLRHEEALNSATLAERCQQDRALGKFYKMTQSEAGKLKGR